MMIDVIANLKWQVGRPCGIPLYDPPDAAILLPLFGVGQVHCHHTDTLSPSPEPAPATRNSQDRAETLIGGRFSGNFGALY